VLAVELADLAFSLDNVVAVIALSDHLLIVMNELMDWLLVPFVAVIKLSFRSLAFLLRPLIAFLPKHNLDDASAGVKSTDQS
jgi:predicted tellurium resistance membrane protein TerC